MKFLFNIFTLLFLFSCGLGRNHDKNESINVSYLKDLGLFTNEETLIWFDSQLTQKESGNFLSNKRIASYWIDKYDSEKSYQTYIMLKNVDSLRLKDNSKFVTYSSYFEVFSNGKSMKVYVDADSLKLQKYKEEIEKFIVSK